MFWYSKTLNSLKHLDEHNSNQKKEKENKEKKIFSLQYMEYIQYIQFSEYMQHYKTFSQVYRNIQVATITVVLLELWQGIWELARGKFTDIHHYYNSKIFLAVP